MAIGESEDCIFPFIIILLCFMYNILIIMIETFSLF